MIPIGLKDAMTIRTIKAVPLRRLRGRILGVVQGILVDGFASRGSLDDSCGCTGLSLCRSSCVSNSSGSGLCLSGSRRVNNGLCSGRRIWRGRRGGCRRNFSRSRPLCLGRGAGSTVVVDVRMSDHVDTWNNYQEERQQRQYSHNPGATAHRT